MEMRRCGILCAGVACIAILSGIIEAGAQENDAQEVPVPGEYQWIFGKTQMPAVDEEGQLAGEEASSIPARTVLRKEDFIAKERPVPASEEQLYEQGASLDPFTWHFGEVEAGRVLEHEFVIENKSKRQINITSVNTSCGCTVSQVEKTSLLPGEQTPISVSFKTKGYSGDVKQSVFVHTDDPRQPVIRYVVKARIVRKGGP